MKSLTFALLALAALVLCGCSKGMTGTYQATVEEPTKDVVGAKAKYEILVKSYSIEPRILEFKDGRFELKVGGMMVQQGDVRVDGNQVILRADSVKGRPVLEQLRVDQPLTKRNDGTLVDDKPFAEYGILIVFHPKVADG